MAQFPHELVKAIEGLNNKHRQEILLTLNEVEKLSFSGIQEKIGINRPLLANHLKKLSRKLLIEHFYEHEVGNENFSYYRLSPFGKALLDNMMGTLYFRRIKSKITLFAQLEWEETATVFKSFKKHDIKIAESSSGERKEPAIIFSEEVK
jgi:DNA-binding HxlR family transcriptional regulator